MNTVTFVWIRNIIAFALILGLLLASEAHAQQSRPEKFTEIERQVMQHRAVEAMIWGMPAVNLDLMYQAMLRETKARENQMLYWSRLVDWKTQTLTPNTDVIYFTPYFDTKEVGPIVLEIPPADDGAIDDKDGQPLNGSETYRLNVPANAPVRQYWSATLYDQTTHALIREVSHAGRSSQSPGLQVNADGSVDLYFGPTAPAGKESNWTPTDPDGKFEILFRFYGPLPALFDKSWVLTNVELVK